MLATLHLTADDLVKMRFAYRPLLEIPLSYRVMVNPTFQAPHRRWIEDTAQSLYGLDFPYLSALITERGYIPDFLTPTPLSSGGNIEDDLDALLVTPDELIRKNIEALIQDAGENAIRLFFLAYPREALGCLVEELRLYWQRALEPVWSRMMSLLEGDILYRGKLLALDGAHTLLQDVHPTIAYRKNQIQVTLNSTYNHCPREVHLEGTGIQLVPTIFTAVGRMIQITPEWQPMILYKARGVGAYSREMRASQSLELALGAGRAHVLQTLVTPSTTGEVAYKLRISAATASQHLSRLTKAGLVAPRRSGKRVYYYLTRRGEQLIALFDRSY